MMKAFFLALGVTMCAFGGEFLAVDKLILASTDRPNRPTGIGILESPAPAAKEYRPREWHPWALLSTGAIIILYSITLPSRSASPPS